MHHTIMLNSLLFNIFIWAAPWPMIPLSWKKCNAANIFFVRFKFESSMWRNLISNLKLNIDRKKIYDLSFWEMAMRSGLNWVSLRSLGYNWICFFFFARNDVANSSFRSLWNNKLNNGSYSIFSLLNYEIHNICKCFLMF